jgi:putative transposase
MNNNKKLRIPEKGHKNLRKGRFSYPGNYYFVTTIVQGKEKIFQKEECANIVIDAIRWMKKEGRVENIVAIVMPEHLHWVFVLKKGTLDSIMKTLKGFTARKINQILGRNGKLWQEQYYEHLIRKDENLLEIAKYCLNNSVRRGIVEEFHNYPYWICKYDV